MIKGLSVLLAIPDQCGGGDSAHTAGSNTYAFTSAMNLQNKINKICKETLKQYVLLFKLER